MQSESEPLARRANAVLERLVAYDRSVSEYLQAGRSSDFRTITAAGERACKAPWPAYYDRTAGAHRFDAGRPATSQRCWPTTSQGRNNSRRAPHNGRSGWTSATRRSIASTTMSPPPAAPGWPSTAPRSSHSARSQSSKSPSTAIRGNFAPGPVMARREQDVRRGAGGSHAPSCNARPAKHGSTSCAKTLRPPCACESRSSISTRRTVPRATSCWKTAPLCTAAVEEQLQDPARARACCRRREHAATSAEAAEHTLTMTGAARARRRAARLGALALSISLPVRRLTAATRLIAERQPRRARSARRLGRNR